MYPFLDEAAAERLFGRLLELRARKAFPFDVIAPPEHEENLPTNMPRLGREHALFLWAVCYYMRGGIESEEAVRRLSALYDAHAVMFFPEQWRGGDDCLVAKQAALEELLKKGSLGYKAAEIARLWSINAQKLYLHYESDPRKLFAGADSFEVLCERMINKKTMGMVSSPFGFGGFRHKMVAMLAHFYMVSGIIPEAIMPAPIDFHVLRMLISHEILHPEVGIEVNLYTTETQAAARYITEHYARTHGVRSVDLSEALWLYSAYMCSNNPYNLSFKGVRNGRKTTVAPQPVVWNDAQLRRYHRSCAQCPIEGSCTWNIASAPYYIQGVLTKRSSRRVVSLPLFLF